MGDVRLGQPWTLSQRVRNDAWYGVSMAALFVTLRVMPSPLLAWAGTGVGALAWLALPGMRRDVAERLKAAFGGHAPVRAAQVFGALGRDLADAVHMLDAGERADRSMSLGEGAEEVIRHAWKRGRGVVFATAHLGPIERMAALVASKGYPVATLARESYDPRFTALYDRLRAGHGVQSIYRGRAGADVRLVRALRRGMLVGFPMDLAGRGMATVECDFLGQRHRLPVGPARIALRTGASLLVGTPGPGKNGYRYEVTVESIEAKGDEAAVTAALGRALEARIMAWPEHWVWMYRVQGS